MSKIIMWMIKSQEIKKIKKETDPKKKMKIKQKKPQPLITKQ